MQGGDKAAVRRAVLGRLRAMDGVERSRRAAAVVERVEGLEIWQRSPAILGFHPLGEEIDILPLLRHALDAGKTLWLPRIEGNDLAFHRVADLEEGLSRHRYGMLEPAAGSPVFVHASVAGPVLVLTPGVAFDRECNRLGRGKGYYDRYLRSLRGPGGPEVCAVAVAYAVQLIGSVPHGPGDERVDALATEDALVRRRP